MRCTLGVRIPSLLETKMFALIASGALRCDVTGGICQPFQRVTSDDPVALSSNSLSKTDLCARYTSL